MAVHERTWKAFSGRLTPERTRFMVPVRYAFQGVFASKLFTAFYALCFVPSAVATALIYFRHNLAVLDRVGITMAALPPVDAQFFNRLTQFQNSLAFLLILIVGPGLVSRDLVHNALPLYLSRPFSRTEYVLGKLAVLFFLGSLITWVPTLLLIALQTILAGQAWLSDQGRVLPASLLTAWSALLVYGLLALAMSAYFRKKFLAQAALFFLMPILLAFGSLANAILGTRWGLAIAVSGALDRVRSGLFGVEPDMDLPLPAAVLSVAACIVICLVLLSRKIRAQEIVR